MIIKKLTVKQLKPVLILFITFCFHFIFIQETYADLYVLIDTIEFIDLRVLVTTEGNTRTVVSASLPASLVEEHRIITVPASGKIADPEQGCSALHFHGVISDINDPSPTMCGQGKAIRIDSEVKRKIINDINVLIEAEKSTVGKLDSGFGALIMGGALSDYVSALKDVESDINNHLEILDDLGAAVQEAEADDELKGSEATALLQKITCAVKSDRNAQKIVNKVREAREEDEKLLVEKGIRPAGFVRTDRSRPVRKIEAANRCKKALIELIAEQEIKDD